MIPGLRPYSEYRQRMLELLALEYNCTPKDFCRKENVLTLPELRPGRRVYGKEPCFFHMVTTGDNAVITAEACLHPFLREFMADRPGHWLFELPNLLPLEGELNRYGRTLTQTYHMFLPAEHRMPQRDWPVRWFCDEEIHPFYGDPRFPNAICEEHKSERPDRMVVCAYDGETIMGMAGCSEDAPGCSEDAPGWWQIGIDVMPEYRGRGIGTYLVTLLKNKVLERGMLPFYGTSVSNYHSWNIAIASGFRPAWVEIGSGKVKDESK